ncbi:MAG: hypothetical protein JST16_06920 [Bdellovibrionales bacterium]|nr:hypothetical protein [Bdellovibrionales bacterium]
MKIEALKRRRVTTSLKLFLLAALTGWSVFNLQIVSLLGLIDRAGIEVLPVLMLLQAGISWGLLRLWGGRAQSSPRAFFARIIALGFGVSVFAHSPAMPWVNAIVPGWWVYGVVFIFSQLGVSALRLSLHVTFSRRVSLLSNPQISTQLAIAEEGGLFFGILCVMAAQAHENVGSFAVAVFPFVGSAFVLGALGRERRAPAPSVAASSHQEALAKEDRRRPAFFGWLIALFSAVASLKAMQWFGMAYGLSEAGRRGVLLVGLYSKLGLIQSGLTLTILMASFSFSKRIPTWGLGFRILLWAQGLGAAALAFFPTPYALMGAEVMRKVLEHGFLGRSLQLLTSTLPEEHRLESRHFMERWSTTSGTAIAGVLAWFSVNGYLPFPMLWACMLGIALCGLLLKRRVFDTLCDFHVAHLRQSNLSGVLQACHSLANPDCKRHHAALTGILERNPRPIVAKSLLRALGSMQQPRVVPYILNYIDADREDIQLAAVRAAKAYPGHQVNFFLLRSLREMVRAEVPVRVSVMNALTERLGRLVVPYLLEVLESPANERATANAVEVLGGLADDGEEGGIRDYLAKFLDSSYASRIRANAIVALYRDKQHGTAALEAFDRLLTSDSEEDLDTSAYIAGMLKLRGHESFIWERSEARHHQSMTLLVALLRLGNPRAARLLARQVVGDNEEKALDALVRLSAVDQKTRAEVLYEILEISSQSLDTVLVRMRRSQRDFEIDRELIREEAHRLGYVLNEGETPEVKPILKEAA